MSLRRTILNFFGLLALLAGGFQSADAERIKDLATVGGVRSNQLVGYGLVVGLDGTGDRTTQAPFTAQTLANMLEQLGITLPPGTNLQLKNIASVAVHADLPAFAKPGQLIDITVSSIANADSLRGGTLLMTPLRAIDGQVYAIAQGNLVVGGLGVSGSDGSRISINIPSVGRIPNGASVEREVPMGFAVSEHLSLNLHNPDFTTATRLAAQVNATIGEGSAAAIDSTTIQVSAPRDPSQRTSFVAMLENLQVEPGEAPARVIINSRTGTVVISTHVRVTPAAVAHGSLVVTISEDFGVSQPAPFTRGGAEGGANTVVTPETGIDIYQETDGNRMFLFEPGVDLNEIVQAVNQVGAAPGDLVAILEALREAGALRAELLVI
ncbi:MAG: flagellar basal body P-ring protein FlgI [Gammaproteobacteria bacterium]|nr:flagellar basal body P-ring protein FlgI [Gammaproteobacteria bacterium]